MPPTAAATARREGIGPPADSSGTFDLRTAWSDEEWDRVIARCPEATFFHTRTWARLIVASFPALRDESIWCETGAGPFLFPLYSWRRAGGLFTTFHSSFPFLYGGSIPAQGMDGGDRVGTVLRHLRRPWTSVRVAGNPFASTPGGEVAGYRLQPEVTHLMDLPATEEEYWERGLSAARRNDVRRLGKKEVRIEETRDLATVGEVYGLYQRSFRRWRNRPAMVYPHALYRNLLLQGGNAVRFTVARQGTRLLGGTFTVRWNGRVHYLAGYSDPEVRALRPNVLLQVEAIQAAIRDGYRCYDFLPSGGHRSVETFKEGLGGRRTLFPVYRRSGLLHRFLGRGLSERKRPVRIGRDRREFSGYGRTEVS